MANKCKIQNVASRENQELKLTSQIALTPSVLEGEINAGFLKDYVFISVFPDPVPVPT